MNCDWSKRVSDIVILLAVVFPLSLGAQQHAFFHSFEYRSTPAGLIMIGGPPVHAVYAPLPQYTQKAQAAKVVGALVLDATLGVDGCVRDVKMVRRLGFGLDETAIEAVLRWRFHPFLKNGAPAETKGRGELSFDPSWSPLRSLSKEKKCGVK